MSFKLLKHYTQAEKLDFMTSHEGMTFGETVSAFYALDPWEELVIDEDRIINHKQRWNREQFEIAKANKLQENIDKCNEKRYNQEFTVTLQSKECVFDTSEETQRDLQTVDGVTSKGLTYDGWVTNNDVEINLTAQDVITIFSEFYPRISPLYKIQKAYKEQILSCTTKAEIDAIIIDYDAELDNLEE